MLLVLLVLLLRVKASLSGTRCGSLDYSRAFTLGIVAPVAREPVAREKLGGAFHVRLSLSVLNGTAAAHIREHVDEYQVCYGGGGLRHCVSLASAEELALVTPRFVETSFRVYAWLERPACLFRRVAADVDIFVETTPHPSESGTKILAPANGAVIKSDYAVVDVDYFYEGQEKVSGCFAVFDRLECVRMTTSNMRLRRDLSLPAWTRHQLFAWIQRDNGLRRENNSCSSSSESSRSVSSFAMRTTEDTYLFAPYRSLPRLTLAENFTVTFPKCRSPRSVACVLRRRVSCGNDCHYFQHAAPFLMACWSFFRSFSLREREIVTRDGLSLATDKWTRGFLEAINASVLQEAIPNCAIVGSLKEEGSTLRYDTSRPGTERDLGWTPLGWLTSRDDAADLADAVLPTECHISSQKKTIRIGVLNRENTGSLVETAGLVERLNRQQRLNRQNIEVSEMFFEKATFEAQASWMRQRDVVISPHGAQLTNVVFLRPCAALLEIFPKFYYIPGYFSTLARAVGALPFLAYPGTDPDKDMARVFAANETDANNFRKAPLPQAATDALTTDAITAMINARERCLARRRSDRRLSSFSPVHQAEVLRTSSSSSTTEVLVVTRIQWPPPRRDLPQSSIDETWFDDDDDDDDVEWFVCSAILGDRHCSPMANFIKHRFDNLPRWSRSLKLSLTTWVEKQGEGMIDPRHADFLVGPNHTIPLSPARIGVSYPKQGDSVRSPVALAFFFHGDGRDYRGYRFCYAVIDQRRCSPAWPYKRGVDASESTRIGLEPLSLPPGTHQLLVWLQLDEDDVDIFATRDFIVLPPSP